MTGSAVRHFLELDTLSSAELHRVLALADDGPRDVLAGRSVALYFEKPSLRTRHSSEAAVSRLGGHPITFNDNEVSIGSREPAGDIARVLSGYHAALGGRVFDHALLEALADASSIPVINLLSDRGHPCQAVADLLTMQQQLGGLAGKTVAWIGDYNNVAHSLCLGAGLLGMRVQIASPNGYGPSEVDIDRMIEAGVEGMPVVTLRPEEAVKDADAVHTDVWASMGQEHETELRRRQFEGFQVDDALMAIAPEHAIFMHCLPAHRGEEVAASVVDGPRSRVIPQAHNRMHAMIGLFRWLAEVGSLGGSDS